MVAGTSQCKGKRAGLGDSERVCAARWEAESAASAAGMQKQCIFIVVALCQHLFGPLVNLYETLHRALVDFSKVLAIFQVQQVICRSKANFT